MNHLSADGHWRMCYVCRDSLGAMVEESESDFSLPERNIDHHSEDKLIRQVQQKKLYVARTVTDWSDESFTMPLSKSSVCSQL